MEKISGVASAETIAMREMHDGLTNKDKLQKRSLQLQLIARTQRLHKLLQ
jgi:hypothetical protein